MAINPEMTEGQRVNSTLPHAQPGGQSTQPVEDSPEDSAAKAAPLTDVPAASDDPLNPAPAEIIEESPE
ncbi:MAG: hypothetical protein NW220_04610 [Leptolyngbyaceae cyanobacterium bins.349]|nr:hypothetical protein [Leptolyngbyaceae cyanobacterium bins.349]